MQPPRNRKQRREAAAASTSSPDTFDPSSIPLARPSRDRPTKSNGNEKTLVDIISERQNELLHGGNASTTPGTIRGLETKFVTIDPASGKISPFDGTGNAEMNKGKYRPTEEPPAEAHQGEHQEENDAPIPPFLDTLLLSFPLTTLHLTLAYLAAHQYAQRIDMHRLLRESGFVAFPMLTLLIHLAHGHILFSNRKGAKESEVISLFPFHRDKLSLSFLRRVLFPPSLRTMVFFPLAVVLGTKLMAMTNDEPYYAVMKRAPAIGTLWVWCILEVPVGAAALGALGPMIWGVWWKGYGII